MRVLAQRSLASSVFVEGKCIGKIDNGMVVFVGFKEGDTIEDLHYCLQKLIHLRIFEDETGKMNQSILDKKGSVLSISQFTLYGNIEKGNRPSFTEALNAEAANMFYNLWNKELAKYVSVETGIFGADMKVNIVNDGPVTILIESRKKND